MLDLWLVWVCTYAHAMSVPQRHRNQKHVSPMIHSTATIRPESRPILHLPASQPTIGAFRELPMSTCALNQPVALEPDPTIDVDALLSEDRIGPRDGAGKTAVVAMSGGVDSAVTALLMRER